MRVAMGGRADQTPSAVRALISSDGRCWCSRQLNITLISFEYVAKAAACGRAKVEAFELATSREMFFVWVDRTM